MDIATKFSNEFNALISQNSKMNFDSPGTASSILIFRHYLSELYNLKQLFGDGEFYVGHRDFHNLFLNINPLWKEEMPSINDFYELVTKKGFDHYRFRGRSYNGIFIYLFICWEIFKDKDEIQKYSIYGNPYKSIMKIIERNQLIYRSEGHFYIGDIIYLRRGQNKFLLPSINNDFLKLIDKKYPVKAYNSFNIPKQEEVDDIWEEFNTLL